MAGRKSRGGGRPRRELADLMDYGGEVAVEELIRIVDQGESHALYLDAADRKFKAPFYVRHETWCQVEERWGPDWGP